MDKRLKAIFIKKLVASHITSALSKFDHTFKCHYPDGTPMFRIDSGLRGSTSAGYLIQDFIFTQIQDKGYLSPESPHEVYDLEFLTEGIKVYINLKVELNGGTNRGIAVLNKLKSLYEREEDFLYMIVKLNYDYVDDSIVIDKALSSFYLEEFLSDYKNIDRRNWNREFKYTSGRVLSPTNKMLKALNSNIISRENTLSILAESKHWLKDEK